MVFFCFFLFVCGQAFIHVSTAYANCDKDEITEKIYTPSVDPRRLMDCTDWMDQEMIQNITKQFVERISLLLFMTVTFFSLWFDSISEFSSKSDNVRSYRVLPSFLGDSWWISRLFSTKRSCHCADWSARCPTRTPTPRASPSTWCRRSAAPFRWPSSGRPSSRPLTRWRTPTFHFFRIYLLETRRSSDWR